MLAHSTTAGMDIGSGHICGSEIWGWGFTARSSKEDIKTGHELI